MTDAILKRTISEYWRASNRCLFGGSVTLPKIEIRGPTGDCWAWVEYDGRTPVEKRDRIWYSKCKLVVFSDAGKLKDLLGLVLHEQIHAYLLYVRKYDSRNHHDAFYREYARYIAKLAQKKIPVDPKDFECREDDWAEE